MRKLAKWIAALAVICVIGVAAAYGAARLYYKVDYADIIQEAADEYQVNPYWLIAMVKCESNFDSDACSDAGAVGLMQLLPETAADIERWELVDSSLYSADDLSDPETNINYGAAYIRYLVERYHEMDPAIAAYNAGMGNVDEWLDNDSDVRKSVEFEETEEYLARVKKAKEMYERLYPNLFDWSSDE